MHHHLILGTAGHIDHGKTSLIRALTGIDTDRLPEEQRRGITIELGFAHLQVGPFHLGIVDAPGHERFVRHMLAGATGMDLALLVVAADDSVKPQTVEHLDVLRMLDLPAGVIALTKCDLVEAEWIELVEDEVRQLVAGTPLEHSPIVRTSVVTGAGLESLSRAILEAAETAARSDRVRRVDGPFRMAIDRVFTVAGHGTVVTGSISSGRARVGDRLVLHPSQAEVRIRGLQRHDRETEQVGRGERAAINLAGVRHEQLVRGYELASPGHLVPSRRLLVHCQLLPNAPRSLKRRTRLRFHVGTVEVMATAELLECDQLKPGGQGPVQMLLSEPVVTTWNQPFVLRSESPVTTIGGGRVRVPEVRGQRRVDRRGLEMLDQLASADLLPRGAAAAFFLGAAEWEPGDLSRTAEAHDPVDLYRRLVESGQVLELAASAGRAFRLHRCLLERLEQAVVDLLARLHRSDPLRLYWDRGQVLHRLRRTVEPALGELVVRRLEAAGKIRTGPRGIGLAGVGPRLARNEQRLLEELVEQHRRAALQPPSISQCQQQAKMHRESVPKLLALAAAQGDLVPVSSDFYLHADHLDTVRKRLVGALSGHPDGLTVSQIREMLDTSRKYAVPLCEYLDGEGFTVRRGDRRVLGPQAVAWKEEPDERQSPEKPSVRP